MSDIWCVNGLNKVISQRQSVGNQHSILLLDYSFGLVEAVFVAPRSEELGITT